MPLFGSHSSNNVGQEHETSRKNSGPSSFGFSSSRNRHGSDSSGSSGDGRPNRQGSILSRFREQSPTGSQNRNTLMRGRDPSIQAARQKVTNAENAEKDADKALDMARKAVKEARQHVKDLEAAALEEARRAQLKQKQAKTIRKGADRLGRHDHH